MTREQAKADIMKALDSYDDGRITKAMLAEAVDESIKRLAEASYDRGFGASVDDDDKIIEFESDMDEDDDDLDIDDDENTNEKGH